MADYFSIIEELEATPEQVAEAEKYALAVITAEVYETHPDAVVLVEEGIIHIVSEDHSDDLIFPMQLSFNANFAIKIKDIQGRSQEPRA